MKGYTGAALLSLAAAFAGLAHAKEDMMNMAHDADVSHNMNMANDADAMHNTNMAHDADSAHGVQMAHLGDMASMPMDQLMQQAVPLIQRTPDGGYIAYGAPFGHKKGDDYDDYDNEVEVSGSLDVALSLDCPYGRKDQCQGYCTNITSDAENCGQCGIECPVTAKCTKYENYPKAVCVCPKSGDAEGLCQLGDDCVPNNHNDACGTTCKKCPKAQICDGGDCVCPTAANPDLCPARYGVASFCTNKMTNADNCGACFSPCPSGRSCVNGRCSNTCNSALCPPAGNPTPCGPPGTPAQACFCAKSQSGPYFCLANFDPCDRLVNPTFCMDDKTCGQGYICDTTACADSCRPRPYLGVCRPVDTTCNVL